MWPIYREDKCIRLVVEGTVEMRAFGRPSRRWKDNIKVHLENKMVYGLDSFGSDGNKLRSFMKTVGNFRFP